MLKFGHRERIQLLPPRSLVPRSRPSQREGGVFPGHGPREKVVPSDGEGGVYASLLPLKDRQVSEIQLQNYQIDAGGIDGSQVIGSPSPVVFLQSQQTLDQQIAKRIPNIRALAIDNLRVIELSLIHI